MSNLKDIKQHIREIWKVVLHPRYDVVFKKNDVALFKLTVRIASREKLKLRAPQHHLAETMDRKKRKVNCVFA